MSLKARIQAAYEPGIEYHTLLRRVFPYEEYPKAWRYSHNGGPPACAMPFGRALRELNGRRDGRNRIWIPGLNE